MILVYVCRWHWETKATLEKVIKSQVFKHLKHLVALEFVADKRERTDPWVEVFVRRLQLIRGNSLFGLAYNRTLMDQNHENVFLLFCIFYETHFKSLKRKRAPASS